VNRPFLQFVIGNNGPLRKTPFRLRIAARTPLTAGYSFAKRKMTSL
jgi:hypothetical protein